jgi:hypothetical protein
MKAPMFPTIPTPDAEVKSLQRSVEALKRVVEMLTGTDTKSVDGTSSNRFASHVFVQRTEPVAIHLGDLWLCTAGNASFNIWDGTNWVVITNIAALPAAVRAYTVGTP